MKNTIKGNFVGFTNGDPTITNSKVTIKEMTNNKQQTEMNAVEYLDKVNQFAKENNTGKPRQQTAVEWLLNAIETKNGEEFSSYYTEFIEQAKEMDKEQKIRDFTDGYLYRGEQLSPWLIDKWYKETYGGGEQ